MSKEIDNLKRIERIKKEFNCNYREISINDPDYPKKLKMIKNPPETLYVLGNLPDENKKSVAISGNRASSDYSNSLSNTIAKQLAKNDVQIISGLSMGVSTAAHLGALEVNKPNFAVMGNSVEICFPSHNQKVYEEIIKKGGGIISELPLGSPPLPQNFPKRNRIIAGLSDTICIVEHKENSISQILVDYGIEQEKAIFACPQRISDINSRGTNSLIKQGAHIFTDIYDIFEHLNINTNDKKQINIDELNWFDKCVLNALNQQEGSSLNIDQIAEKTKMPYQNVKITLMELEQLGYVKSGISNHYILNQKVDIPKELTNEKRNMKGV